jgi:hypothetical protein
MKVHKMSNGQYAVCWQTVNAWELLSLQWLAGIPVANDIDPTQKQ